VISLCPLPRGWAAQAGEHRGRSAVSRGNAEAASGQGRRGNVWYVPGSGGWPQSNWQAGAPQAAIDVLQLRSEARDGDQPGLAHAAPSATAIVGAMIVGAGLIIAVLFGDLVLGASLRGVVLTSANFATAAVMEALLIVGILAGAFLACR
jgi:hypothetical protein